MDDSKPQLSDAAACDVAIAVAQFLDGQRAEDIVVLDVREVLPITSYFVLASGTSSRAIKNLGDGAEKLLRTTKFPKEGVESDLEGTWVCIDYQEVVVHVFSKEAREFYDMDNLWADAPRVEVAPSS